MNNLSSMIACHECDLLHELKELSFGQGASCSRCGAKMYRRKRETVDRTLALAISGLIIYIPANFYPIIVLKVIGSEKANSLFTGVRELFHGEFWFVATLVLLTSIVLPFINLFTLGYTMLSIKLDRMLPHVDYAFKIYSELHVWGMLEVYMLGILVALTKLGSIAKVELGLGLYCFIGLLIITFFSSISLDRQTVWRHIEEWKKGV